MLQTSVLISAVSNLNCNVASVVPPRDSADHTAQVQTHEIIYKPKHKSKFKY
jgi:hypothetical protein